MTQSPEFSPSTTPEYHQFQLQCLGLPLAVYREVASHLQQVEGVEVRLLPQRSQTFDYAASQVGGIQIRYPQAAPAQEVARIEQILTYYGDRFGTWQTL